MWKIIETRRINICIILTLCAGSFLYAISDASDSGISTPPHQITTVALLPFHNRAGVKYANLATVIAMASGNMIMQSSRISLVERVQIDKIFDEKTNIRPTVRRYHEF